MSVFDQENLDENKDFLTELTGPGGKFDRTKYASDQEMYQAIAKSNVHGSRMIDNKNKEFDELRETLFAKTAEANTAAKLDELLKKLENRDTTDTTNNQNVGNVTTPVLDESKIEDLVANKLNDIEAKRNEKANLDKVDQRLREEFGSNAGSILRDKMNTLGISNEDLKYLAKKSPEAVFNALGLNQRQTNDFHSIPKSSTRTDSFKYEPVVRDAVFWEKMKNENFKEYFSQKNSVQRLKDMENPDFFTKYNERRA